MRRVLLIMGVVTAASPARAKDAARDPIAALVEQQLLAADSRVEPEEAKAPYADGATIVLTGVGQWEPIAAPDQIQLMNPQGHEVKHLDVVWSRDRKTAVVTFEATVTEASYGRDPDTAAAVDFNVDSTYRVSDVVAQIDGRWKIVASAWSTGADNRDTNRAARSHDGLRLVPLPAGTLDAAMDRELLAWIGGAAGARAAKHAVVFGSAPGERTTDGPAFQRAWRAGWVGRVEIAPGRQGALAPSGTTGWIAATITRDKGSYQVPFCLFVVFDRAADGTWQLAHAHFATRSF